MSRQQYRRGKNVRYFENTGAMTSSGSQIDEPQRGRSKRAELRDVNINTGAKSIRKQLKRTSQWDVLML